MKKLSLLLIFFLTITINAQEAYYSDVDLTAEGITLKEKLAIKVTNTHTNTLSYGELWNALKATDEDPANANNVLLIYGYSDSDGNYVTDKTRSKSLNGGTQGTDWNREHVYAKSKGTPNLGTSGPGADGQHLRPSDVRMNSNRGSLKFADGSGNAGSVSGGWYPGDEWKGDVARIMMYMYIRYGDRCLPTNIGVGSAASTPDNMIDLFLEWNVEDPVSDFERQRNTYHENTSNTYAQGNRNPFIDNAYLATRIWGGDAAIDSWGIYTSTDTEAPTVPTDLALSNITTTSIDATWTASTDNEAVTKYEIYVDGTLNDETANTTFTITGLTPNTTYAVSVLAKDIANNKSDQTTAVNGTTLSDSTPPTVPTAVTISNETGTSFKASWSASTDDSGVASYDVFIDGVLNGNTTNTEFVVTGLTISTTYTVTVLAKDAANNQSAQSAPVNGTTTDGTSSVAELFFSEYVEGGGYNKALEIVNLTANPVDLSTYSVKRQSNGTWETALNLSGSIAVNDVFVIINSATPANQHLLDEADLQINNSTPMTFNGNDRVGLFKSGTLIDIIGDLDGTDNFAKDVTLRRKSSVSEPNTTYTISEWDEFPKDTVDGIGSHTSTLSTEDHTFSSFKMFPNPTNGNKVYFSVTEDATIKVYNTLGKLIATQDVTLNNNSIDVSNLGTGVYLLKIKSDKQYITKKLIKK
ncbi:hypothetical protein LPB136_02880 [Tenacibaculum todarodis]|uniref:Endonuclease I n=1 Tax=Tenacibaculum todarodis TaxID=1850252 RepID=A0A1L3JGV9_9FLAO|nr:endonuclease [Tenacibaculum todarodis]APG64375.1 hypothetical protein LPB136_02880 [Tenacibaculum todarodis]